MKKIKSKALRFKNPHSGKESAAKLKIASYMNNGSLYVGLYLGNGKNYYDDITVNLPEEFNIKPPKNCAYIKDEFGELATFLISSGLAKDTGLFGMSGFCTYKLFDFDEVVLRENDPDGYEEYLAAYELNDC